MHYAIKRINEDDGILPGITLGMNAFDTCANETTALDRTVGEFITCYSLTSGDFLQIQPHASGEGLWTRALLSLINRLISLIRPSSYIWLLEFILVSLPFTQGAFHVGHAEDLRREFQKRSACWRKISLWLARLAQSSVTRCARLGAYKISRSRRADLA